MQAKILNYFKNNQGFQRILASMFDIYVLNGRTFGAVRIVNPSKAEESALSTFFGRDYYNQALIRVSLADFERQLKKTFPDITPDAVTLGNLLESYFEKPVKKIEKPKSRKFRMKETLTAYIIENLLPLYKYTPAEDWLRAISTHQKRSYRIWAEEFLKNPSDAGFAISTIANVLNTLPARKFHPDDINPTLIRPADFNHRLADNAHEALLIRAMAFYLGESLPITTEDTIKLYQAAGFLYNAALSQVLVRGLETTLKEGKSHTACKFYASQNQPHVLTLENISQIESIKLHSGSSKTVYILENPQIFATVCERLYDTKCIIISPLKSAASAYPGAFLQLLKLCQKAGANLQYAGNLTFRGLSLADELYLKFGKSFVPWRYSQADYTIAISESSMLLPEEKRPRALHNETLASLLSTIKNSSKTASSTPLIPYFIRDIKNNAM